MAQHVMIYDSSKLIFSTVLVFTKMSSNFKKHGSSSVNYRRDYRIGLSGHIR